MLKSASDTLRYIRTSGLLAPTTATPKGERLLLTGGAPEESEILTAATLFTEHINDTTTKEVLTESAALALVSYAGAAVSLGLIVVIPLVGHASWHAYDALVDASALAERPLGH